MNPTDLQMFNSAVVLAQSGNTAAAHASLLTLNQRYPDESNVLLWLAFTSSNLKEARAALEKVARNDAANPALPSAQSWLAGQEATQVQAQPVFQAVAVAEPAYATATAATPSSAPAQSWSVRDNTTSGPMASSTFSKGDNDASSEAQEAELSNYGSAPAEKGSRWVGIAFVGCILFIGVGLIAGVLMVLGSLSDVGDMPAPASSRKIDIDTKSLGSLGQGLNFNDTKYGIFATAEKATSLSGFYSAKMSDKGWTTAANMTFSPMSLQYYTKGDRVAVVLVYGPLAKKDLAQMLQGSAGKMDGKINEGETLVVLLEASAKDLKLP